MRLLSVSASSASRPVSLRARFLGAAILCAAGVVAESARGDELSDLEKAYGAYVAHHYDDAEVRLRQLLGKKESSLRDADSVADARMYLGAVLIAEGKKEEASAIFEQLLLDKPDYQPDPLRVALPALDAVVDARVRLRDELGTLQAEKVRRAAEQRAKIEAERQKSAAALALLEKLAAEEVVVERHTRWEALLPFGIGQFHNGQPALGWSFLATETVLAAGSAIGVGLAVYNESQAYDAYSNGQGTARGYQSRAADAAIAGNVMALGFATLVAVGAIQAEVAFVPEHVRIQPRLRPLPTAPSSISLAPYIGPLGVGVEGRF